MNGREKSDTPVVPTRASNKTAQAVAEKQEGRGVAKGNPGEQNMLRTQSRERMTSALDRIRVVAKRDKKAKFSALLHHISEERLTAAYFSLKKKAAAGIDGVTWEEYGRNLTDNIRELHGRIHRGAYRPQPTRRTYIPKSDGGQRPLGIATVEDKVAQAAVAEVLNTIYEVDFFAFCYGYRKRKSQHDALDALATAIERKRVNWIVDADIKGFFDNIEHSMMQRFLEHRIADKRVVHLIMRWLKAGVMEEGIWSEAEKGSPQGATISPLLANLYLFYAFDQWVHHWRRKKANGDVVVVRYADDFVVGFERQAEAEKFLQELRERLAKFKLELHPEKTRLIEFGRYAAERRKARGEGKPENFTFLGFTHICATTRKGGFALKRITNRKRMRRSIENIKDKLRKRRHDPIPEQGKWLRSVIRGFDAYYSVPGNIDALGDYRAALMRIWQQALNTRSQKARITVAKIASICAQWFPKPKVHHPWPERRFDVKHPRQEPDAVMPLVRICAGGAR